MGVTTTPVQLILAPSEANVNIKKTGTYYTMDTFAEVLGLTELHRPSSNTPSMEAGRKRRLDHLSLEEKINRKKLKNRVAAQTSRDRKKARMDELEDEIKALKSRNHLLASHNRRLKAEKENLSVENLELRQQIHEENKRQPLHVGCCPLNSRPAEGERTAAGTEADDFDFLDDALRDLPDMQDDTMCNLEELAASLLRQASQELDFLVGTGDGRSTSSQAVVGPSSEHVESSGDILTVRESVLSGNVCDDKDSMDITQVSRMEDMNYEEVAEEVEVMTSDVAMSPVPSEHWSDGGYESLDSPHSTQSDHSDLNLWSDSFSELFPALV